MSDMSEWISVNKQLPQENTRVLAFDKEEGVVMAYCETYNGGLEVYHEWHDTLFYRVYPSHWMPLPEPPKEE